MAKEYESIADKVKVMDCDLADAGKSKRELAALHAYKASFVNELEKLYKVWGHEAADNFIRPMLQRL